MKKLIDLEAALETLSIQKGYLLDVARLHREDGNRMAEINAFAEVRGLDIAMSLLKQERVVRHEVK